jgi:hypothetical protein
MPRRAVVCAFGCLTLLATVAGYALWFQHRPGYASVAAEGRRPGAAETIALAHTDPPGTAGAEPAAGDGLPKLEETPPPAGLPIVAWGHRDFFPVIRKPWYVTARQGDVLLAEDEPVLGLVLGGEARAYSTNQLNKHEMVLDQVAGTPVLVTY